MATPRQYFKQLGSIAKLAHKINHHRYQKGGRSSQYIILQNVDFLKKYLKLEILNPN